MHYSYFIINIVVVEHYLNFISPSGAKPLIKTDCSPVDIQGKFKNKMK